MSWVCLMTLTTWPWRGRRRRLAFVARNPSLMSRCEHWPRAILLGSLEVPSFPWGHFQVRPCRRVVHCGGRELLCVQDAVEVKHLSQPANLFIWARKFCGDLPKDQRAALVLVLRLLLQSYFFTTVLVLHADGEDLLVSTIHAILWEHKVT